MGPLRCQARGVLSSVSCTLPFELWRVRATRSVGGSDPRAAGVPGPPNGIGFLNPVLTMDAGLRVRTNAQTRLVRGPARMLSACRERLGPALGLLEHKEGHELFVLG